MGVAIGELHGGLTINVGGRKEPVARRKGHDCETCKHAYVTPEGDVTKLTRNDGSVMIQMGKSTMCMDESTTKSITMRDGDFICSAYEPKELNPRRKPATQADVLRAWDDGVMQGIRHADVIFMSVLVDKHAHEVDVMQVWDEIGKLAAEIKEGRVSMADLRCTLREEYRIEL